MTNESRVSETRVLTGLRVPESLFDLVEDWSRHTGHDAGDILRSFLNLGLVRYVEMFPDSVRLISKALNDLDAMAPERARHERLHAVEQSNGRVRLQQQDISESDAVTIEVAAQPALAALLKGQAEQAETTISEMLLWCWCVDALGICVETGDVAAMRAILMAWHEHGVPEHLRPSIDKLTSDMLHTETTGRH